MKQQTTFFIIILIGIGLFAGLYLTAEPLFWEHMGGDAGGVHASLVSFSVFPGQVSVGDPITISYEVLNDGTNTAGRYIDICLILDWNRNEQKDDFDIEPNVINCPFFSTEPGQTHTSNFELIVLEEWVDWSTNEIPLCLHVKIINEDTDGWYEFGQGNTLSLVSCNNGESECRGDEYWECQNGNWVRDESQDSQCTGGDTYTLTVNTNPEDCVVTVTGGSYNDLNISIGGQSVFNVPVGNYTVKVQKYGYLTQTFNVTISIGGETVNVILDENPSPPPGPTPGFELITFLIVTIIIVYLDKKRR